MIDGWWWMTQWMNRHVFWELQRMDRAMVGSDPIVKVTDFWESRGEGMNRSHSRLE